MGHNPARKGIGGHPKMIKKQGSENQPVKEIVIKNKLIDIEGQENGVVCQKPNLNREKLDKTEGVVIVSEGVFVSKEEWLNIQEKLEDGGK